MVRSSASAATSARRGRLDHAGPDALLRPLFQRARDAQPDIAAADDDDALLRLAVLPKISSVRSTSLGG
jgi:hypothetical protein